MAFAAVIFDLGGVVLDSPLHAIARYEAEHGLPGGFVNGVVVATGSAGAWGRLERGELSIESFYVDFAADCAGAGHRVDARDLMERIGQAAAPRPVMIEAIRRLRDQGLRVGALTNNWVGNDGHGTGWQLRSLFDVVVESSVVGLHKPDPRIYELTCRQLDIAPAEAVFLDDIGRNLKAARALGMTTIKVEDPEVALEELGRILGVGLLDGR
jgi:putative hydrolase of the HAD superfamily